MALNYFKGTIFQMGEVKSGTSSSGREWARTDIILDIPGYQGTTYKVVIVVGPDKDKVDEVLKFKVGDKVELACSIYAREWNGKYYNNIDLVNIKPLDTQSTSSAPSPTVAKAEEIEDMPEGEDGGMPF